MCHQVIVSVMLNLSWRALISQNTFRWHVSGCCSCTSAAPPDPLLVSTLSCLTRFSSICWRYQWRAFSTNSRPDHRASFSLSRSFRRLIWNKRNTATSGAKTLNYVPITTELNWHMTTFYILMMQAWHPRFEFACGPSDFHSDRLRRQKYETWWW